MIVKASFLVAASFAAFAVSQINNSTRKESTIIKIQDGTFMEAEKVEEEEEEPQTASNIPDEDKKEAKMMRSKMVDDATETDLSSVLKRDLEKRKLTLDWKLLELHGLKEEKAYMAQLQRHLKEKLAEIDMLNMTLGSLQAEEKNLKEEINKGFLEQKQLVMAKKTILEMQRKINVNARNVKGKVLMIEEKVRGIRENETSERDELIEQKLKDAKIVELEVVKMKRRNKEVELERRELAVKLLAAQAKVTSFSHKDEAKIMSKLEGEISTLRSGNEELSRQIETFQKDRFDMLEELVYHRRLHLCLRFEIQCKENPREKPKDSLKNTPTFLNSDEKTYSPTSYPSSSNYSISSNTSSSTESDQVESTTIGSSSSGQNSTIKSRNFSQTIKSFGRCKDDSSVALIAEKRRNSKSRMGLIRRYSASMLPAGSSIRRNKGESMIADQMKPSCPRVRRVSFSDIVKTDDEPNSAERVLDQSGGDENASHNLDTGFEGKENSIDPRVDLKIVEDYDGSESAVSKESKDEDSIVFIFVVLFFFLFALLAYFMQITTRYHKT